ncbi:MAG: peptidoglycan-binding protein [Eubacteriales bacterium]
MTAAEWVKMFETQGQAKAFDTLADMARPYERLGVRISLLIAQGLQESFKGSGGWSKLFLNQNNMHGIKSKKGARLATKEEIEGELIPMNSTFAVYSSLEQGILAYIKLMCGSRYFDVRAAKTWQRAVKQLGFSPYATDSYYDQAVLYWMEKYELYRYDIHDFEDRAAQVFNTTRFQDKGNRVADIQKRLIELGYKIKQDGKYGKNTFAAVTAFQKANALDTDGICGINTFLMLEQKKKESEEAK